MRKKTEVCSSKTVLFQLKHFSHQSSVWLLLRYETPVFCKGDEKHVADMHTDALHILNQQGLIVWSDVRKGHGEEHVRYNTWLSFSYPGWTASGCQQDSVCGGGAKHVSQMWMSMFTLHYCAARPNAHIWMKHLIHVQVKLLIRSSHKKR